MAEFPENPEKVSKEWLHKTLCESLKTENIKILGNDKNEAIYIKNENLKI